MKSKGKKGNAKGGKGKRNKINPVGQECHNHTNVSRNSYKRFQQKTTPLENNR